MNRDDLQSAGNVLRSLVGSGTVQDGLGRVSAAGTTWGFAVFGVLAVVALILTREHRRLSIVLLVGGLSGLAAAGLGTIVKNVVRERRPCQVDHSLARWTGCPASWSFPSNHAVWAGALAVTTVAVAIAVHHVWPAVLGVVTACAISASRVVLGVHYWWDTVAGAVLGVAVAAAALLIVVPRLAASRTPLTPTGNSA